MEIYQRNINTALEKLDAETMLVEAAFLDLDHSITVELRIHQPTRTITGARAEMVKVPFETACRETLGRMTNLEGLVIERGIGKRVANAIGRNTGCVHLVELAMTAIRLAANALVGDGAMVEHREYELLADEDKLLVGLPFLKDTCWSYNSDRARTMLGEERVQQVLEEER